MSLLLVASDGFSQEWTVPVNKKKKASPVKFSEETTKKGESLFNTNCQSCHGNPGKKNFANLTPSPGDPASADYQDQTDGEMFYKITIGKSPMPSFKSILTEEDRWNIISFIRSFNKNYIQPPYKASANETEYTVELSAKKLADSNKIMITAIAYASKNEKIKIKGSDITVYTKRNFGLLQIGNKTTTDENGNVILKFPEDLPGDSLGFVTLEIKFNDEIGEFGESETTVKLLLGKPTHSESLIDTRAMWTVRSQAPYWIIIIYCLVVISVITCLIYILNQLRIIQKLGKEIENKNEKKT
jgi:mono/diheme cytochrome c family protein/ribosomal protein L35AE/L33A